MAGPVIVSVAVASVGLVGCLMAALTRGAFELAPLGLRRGEGSDAPTGPDQVEEPDVEQAVRERLYGSRARAPRA